MLNSHNNMGVFPSDAHRSKMAYIYVRQSSIGQLRHHQESTQLQYRLVERAVTLGWPRERVCVIDDDLGKSGTRSTERPGFQKLIAEIGLGHTGLVVSFDASRLARNNTDWHQLLDLCSLFGVLIADGERLYDPCAYHDRLLLGLSGIMSEAELHQIKLRLHQGGRQKAARGELRVALPAGLAYDQSGATVLNPDEEVQARIAFVFEKFRELRSARAVLRCLRTECLPVPVRPLRGPAPHVVIWRAATSPRILSILHNPAYAGVYVYGRRRSLKGHPGSTANGPKTAKVPLEEWEICLQDAHPGYISWQEFMENQKQLTDNQNHLATSVPRAGSAVLQGIALCGRCGRQMSVRYSGPSGDKPVYCCRADKSIDTGPLCQEVRAHSLDPQIEHILLEALAPDRIDIAVAALEELDTHKNQLERQWALRRERAHYEAERARRQYDAVEPENRLVARSLEKAWEDKLRTAEAVEQDYQQWQRDDPIELCEEDHQALLAMAQDIPDLWSSASTTWADRKNIVRLVIKNVILDAKRQAGEVWFRVIWQTGAVSEHCYKRPVRSYDNHGQQDKLRQRVLELSRQGKMDKQIAVELNADNFISARGIAFNSNAVWLLRKRWGIACAKINGVGFNPRQWPDKSYSVQGTAELLGITSQTVFKYLKKGLLQGSQLAKGQPWKIPLNDDQINSLRERVKRNKRSKREVL